MSFEQNIVNRKNIVYIIPVFIFSLLIIAGFYNFPAGDDYCYSFQTINENDLISKILNDYKNWNGRYISNFLVFINPIAFDNLWLYHLIPAALLLFGWFCLYKLSKVFILCSKSQAAVVSFLALMVIVLQQPEISESIYWYTGAITYFPAGCLAWWIFSLLPEIANRKKIIFICLLLFIVIGFNETIMQISLVFSFLFLIKKLIDKNFKSDYLILFLVIIFSSLIVILAPGNEQRGEMFPENHHLLKSLTWSALQSVRFAGWFLFHPSVIVISILIVFFPMEKYISEQVKKIKPHFYLLLIGASIYLSAFAPYYFTDVLGQHRTYNLAGMLFYPLYFALLFSSAESGYFNKWRTKLISEKSKSYLLKLSVLLIPFCYYGYYLVSESVTGKWKAFYENNTKREMSMKEAIKNNEEEFILEPLKSNSQILGCSDTDGTKNHFIFYCSSEYYKSLQNSEGK